MTGGCNPGRILGRLLAVDHIQLAAPPGCEESARRFFGELLGLEEIPRTHELHIGVEPDFAPARKAHPAFRTDGYDEARERLPNRSRVPSPAS